MNSLFTPRCSTSKLNPYFLLLSNRPNFAPAKAELLNAFLEYPNPDKNFIEQFQSKNGFNARIWELYLSTFFLNSGYGINRENDCPDFLITDKNIVVSIEAVTTNEGSEKKIFIQNDEEHKNYIAHKFGSSLYSKLQKKYWEKQHVAGLPLIFAIAPFHSEDSLFEYDTPLITYLYGIEYFSHYDKHGNLVIEPRQKKIHRYKKKEIPSGFFHLPDSENISAVLFSNSGTISKFNRMGYLKNPTLYPNLTMLRCGKAYSHSPNENKSSNFLYIVGDTNFPESWGQGIHIFHNPHAKHPLDRNFFQDVAQSTIKENYLISDIPNFFPRVSQTTIINCVK